ncbi:MAG: ABC transporter permease [Lachnospiraceae bacterium]|nr:ABC transporter permease [Lachnospiraceae bacterium]
MNTQMAAIIKKDMQSITSNKRMFATLLIVPIVLTIFLPSVFILTLYFVPEEGEELLQLLETLPLPLQGGSSLQSMILLMLNFILPGFFLMIPIMASSVMSAASFVGEKEKRTLETLLYCPLSLKQIFRSKVTASFLISMVVSGISFAAMLVVVEALSYTITGGFVLPDIKWIFILFLVAPAISLIAITLIVRMSAKAQSVEDAQQGAVFLLIPVLLLLIGQFTGILLISSWLLLSIGILCAFAAVILLNKSMSHFQYETLLKN